jgi:16S rRNA (guanine966-N2)-methyltransferase
MLKKSLNCRIQDSEFTSAFNIQYSALGMRVISGTLKGRRIDAPDWPGLRPTSDKLRETLFNVLGPSIVDAHVLDGYAGSGAVGIEALSRGAAHVTFVERDPRAVALIESNLQRCGLSERYAIIRGDFTGATTVSGLERAQIDVAFLDPPYGSAELSAALAAVGRWAGSDTRVIVEHAKRDKAPADVDGLVLTRDLVSGDSALAFYARGSSEKGLTV